MRNGVGLFDMSSFGKIRVEGRDACAFLNRLCSAEMDVAAGRIVYTMMLNEKGGIEADLTVTRLSETAYLLVVPGATLQRNLAWMRAHLGDDFAVITDMTAAESVLCVMGPKARDLMRAVSPDDFSNAAQPFGTAREVEVGMGLARAHRVTYVGEFGLGAFYVSSDQTAHVFEALEEAGAGLGLRLCGLHALDSCRIEKAYRHWGHDITDEDHVLEAGLACCQPQEGVTSGARRCCARPRRAGPPDGAVPSGRTPSRCCSTTRRWCAMGRSSGRSPGQLRAFPRRCHRHGLWAPAGGRARRRFCLAL